MITLYKYDIMVLLINNIVTFSDFKANRPLTDGSISSTCTDTRWEVFIGILLSTKTLSFPEASKDNLLVPEANTYFHSVA